MDDALILAASVAFVSALMGNRTAAALLCSLGASFWITSSLGLFALDLAVLAVILRPSMGLVDELIAALFVVAWMFYYADDQLRYAAGWAVVWLQLMLTFPTRAMVYELTIFREFVSDVIGFIRSRLSRSILAKV